MGTQSEGPLTSCAACFLITGRAENPDHKCKTNNNRNA